MLEEIMKYRQISYIDHDDDEDDDDNDVSDDEYNGDDLRCIATVMRIIIINKKQETQRATYRALEYNVPPF